MTRFRRPDVLASKYRQFGSIATEIKKVFADQNTIDLRIVFSVIDALRAIGIAVSRWGLFPRRIAISPTVDVIAGQSDVVAVPQRLLALELIRRRIFVERHSASNAHRKHDVAVAASALIDGIGADNVVARLRYTPNLGFATRQRHEPVVRVRREP